MNIVFFQFDYYLYILLAHTCFNILSCYSVIVWCSYHIYKYSKQLKNTSHVDRKILEVQKQLSTTLIIQAVIPLITFFIPTIMILLTLFFNIYMPEYFLAAFGILLTYIPLGNALSILFVKAYRKFTIQLLKKCNQNSYR